MTTRRRQIIRVALAALTGVLLGSATVTWGAAPILADTWYNASGQVVQVTKTNPLPVALYATNGSGGVSRTPTGATVCGNVSTAATVLASNTSRLQWSVKTTAGAATIYWRENGTATVGGTTSVPLEGGGSFTDDGPAVYYGAVSAIAKTGTVWVCTVEN